MKIKAMLFRYAIFQRFFFRKGYLSLGLIASALILFVYPQTHSQDALLTQLQNIQEKNSGNQPEKLKCLYALKNTTDLSKRVKDSVYAKILNEIASLELKLNRNYTAAILFTNEALQINKSGKPATSKKDAVFASLNLAYYYEDLGILSKAEAYHDTTIQLSKGVPELSATFLFSKLIRAYLFCSTGDYQKCIEESYEGSKYALQTKDSSKYFSFLNQKAQSYFYLDRLGEAFLDVETILNSASATLYTYEVASALKTKALIYEKNKKKPEADRLFKKAVALRMNLGIKYYSQIADDYTDWGNFYLNTMYDNKNANKCYLNVIKYAQLENDSSGLSKAFINMSEAAAGKKDYIKATRFTIKAMQYLNLHPDENINLNPSSKQLNIIGNKDLIIVLMSNKTSLLFELYKKTHDEKFLKASIKTALLTDTIITQTRNEQSGEQSKLYWRNFTRNFFTNAMEACYIANDAKYAFYFMEKSRAVLLNDKLNELGASSHLSDEDAKNEQDFKTSIAIEQQKLNSISVNSPAYNEQQLRFFSIKDDFQHFTKSLETKYPAYYSYKYSYVIPALEDLQKHLALNKASFVHYFTTDTLAYILSITANDAKIFKLSKNDFTYVQIDNFLRFCSNKNLLNTKNNYQSFATLSNTLYKTLFQPLQIAKGRVIICSDNFLLPFDALCSDITGNNFLINDYIFSYAYSATSLLKQFNTYKAKGDFIGFAPVSFRPTLHVNALLNSATSLAESADHYSKTLLFINEDATKNNFIKNIGKYTVANVFSHASADSSETEPRLYMQDATINLSELQLLNKPATRLVVLSACQTNVGKNATGEGIFSLARGFAAAGIPAVSATLWKADENMIYEVSNKFNEYLSLGMSKDIALHKAKIDFLNGNGDGEKKLPFYWANIVLIGNTEPLVLSTGSNMGWWIAASVITILALIGFVVKKRRIA